MRIAGLGVIGGQAAFLNNLIGIGQFVIVGGTADNLLATFIRFVGDGIVFCKTIHILTAVGNVIFNTGSTVFADNLLTAVSGFVSDGIIFCKTIHKLVAVGNVILNGGDTVFFNTLVSVAQGVIFRFTAYNLDTVFSTGIIDNIFNGNAGFFNDLIGIFQCVVSCCAAD